MDSSSKCHSKNQNDICGISNDSFLDRHFDSSKGDNCEDDLYQESFIDNIQTIKLEDKINILNDVVNKTKAAKDNKREYLENLIKKRKLAEKKISLLKDEISGLNSKISEVNISLQDINKQNRLIAVYIQENQIKPNETEGAEGESIENINDDICNKYNQIDLLSDEIKTYSEFSLDISSEIENLQKSIKELKKENIKLKNEYSKSNKEKREIYFEYLRLKKQINSLETNSQNFLRKLQQKSNDS